MKKIAVVTRSLSAGGAERVVAQLINEWAGAGLECTLILLDICPRFYDTDKRVKIIEIGRLHGSQPVDKLLKYRYVRKQIISEAPDAVLSMPEEIGIYTLLSLIGTGVPVFVSERNDPWRMPYKKISRFLRRIAYPTAKGIIFQSKKAASFFPESIRRKSIILPNPLNESRIPDPWTGERARKIVTAGRLEPQKNQKLLIKAFSYIYHKHPDHVLEIYGDGSLRGELERFASDNLYSDICLFKGEDKDLLEQIKDASVFVLCSDYEGLPNALIEAMACGIPAVTTDYEPGSVCEIIEDGINGLIVPRNDPEKLADAIISLIENKALAQKLSHNALSIRSKLNSAVVSVQWLSFFESRITNRK